MTENGIEGIQLTTDLKPGLPSKKLILPSLVYSLNVLGSYVTNYPF